MILQIFCYASSSASLCFLAQSVGTMSSVMMTTEAIQKFVIVSNDTS